jgi:hypothetical protein
MTSEDQQGAEAAPLRNILAAAVCMGPRDKPEDEEIWGIWRGLARAAFAEA